MGYINPLLRLPAARRLMALPREQREPLEQLMRELRADADREAENAWRRRKGLMAAYWRAVATYSRHCAHMLRKGSQHMAAPAAPRARGALATGAAPGASGPATGHETTARTNS